MEKISYDGCQLISVATYGLPYLSEFFHQKATKVWTKSTYFAEVIVQERVSCRIIEILDSKGVPFKILSQNLQDAIVKERHDQAEILSRLKGSVKISCPVLLFIGSIVPWVAYNRLTDIYEFLDLFVAKNPGKAEIVNLGRTYECREVRVMIIRGGTSRCKKIWIDGGLHAREWITTAVVLYIMNELVVNRSKYGDLLGKVDFFIAPILNPDGYEYSHTTDRLWRNNRRVTSDEDDVGVDMNRRFCCLMDGGCTLHHRRKPSKQRDKEVEQIAKFIRKNRNNMMGFLTLHNYSQLVLYPYGTDGVSYPGDYDNLVRVGEEIAAAISSVNKIPYRAVEIKAYNRGIHGNSVDWAMAEGIPYCYGIELRPSNSEAYPGFLVPHDEIIPTAEEALAGVMKLVSVIVESN